MPVPPGAVIGSASGLVIAALGLWLLWIRPRLRDKAFFALFAVMWGAQVTTASLGLVLDDVSVHRRSAFLSFGLFGPILLLLVRAIRPHGGARWHAAALLATMVAALVQTMTLLLAPHHVLGDVSRLPDGTLSATFGALVLPLFYLPFFAAFWLATATYHQRYMAAGPGAPRAREAGLFAGFALFTAYQTFRNLQLYLFLPPQQQLASGGRSLYVLFFAAGSVLLLALAIRLLAARRVARGPERLLPWALLAPLAVVVLEELVDRAGVPVRTWGSTWGVWRVGMVAVVVATIARAHLFDIDVKIRWTFEKGMLAFVLGSSFFLGKEVLESFWPGQGMVSSLVGAVVVAAVAHPTWRFAARVAQWLIPGAVSSDEYRRVRKIEVYRDTFRSALLDGVITARERSVLEAVRGHLGLSTAEATTIERQVLDRVRRADVPTVARKA